MGLDIALGVVILLGAIRGWLRGFTSQVVRLGAFIACFYLADPVRDLGSPYILSKLPKIDPGLMDRILWWFAALVSYAVLQGLASLMIQMIRKPPEPGEKSRRDDRYAGFLLGLSKGALSAALIAAAVEKYGPDLIKAIPWAEKQTRDSKALAWTHRYEPIPKIWDSEPVRKFVEHIQQNGLRDRNADDTEPSKRVAEGPAPGTEPRSPRLEVPSLDSADSLQLGVELTRELEAIKSQLRQPPD